MNETKPHISSIDLLSKADYQHHLLGAHKTCVHLHHQLLPSIWWVVKMFSIWLSRLFVVGCQDVLWWVVKIFCGWLSRYFVVSYEYLLWWVVKTFCGGLSTCFLLSCQGCLWCVVKLFYGGLSRCFVVGCQDVLTATCCAHLLERRSKKMEKI